MDVQHTEDAPGRHTLTVTVDPAAVERAYGAAQRSIARQVRLAGFRPGHAPLPLVARTHGEQIATEAREALVARTLPDALAGAKLVPVARPEVTVGEVRRGAMFTYTAHVEVLPPVTLARVEGLTFSLPPTNEAPADLEAALAAERAEGVELQPAPGREQVGPGDAVVADVAASREDGRAVPELAARGLLVDTEDPDLLDGLAAAVVGQRVPGEVAHVVTLPSNYGRAHLAGRRVTLRLSLLEIKERVLPPLDDALAQDRGHESLAAWREDIVRRQQEGAQRARERAREEAVWEAFLAANPVAVPDGLVGLEVDELIGRAFGDVRALPRERHEELARGLREPARRRLALGLLVEQVAKERQIAVADQAVTEEAERRAAEAAAGDGQPSPPTADPAWRDRLRGHLLERKVLAHLLAHATASAGEPAPPLGDSVRAAGGPPEPG